MSRRRVRSDAVIACDGLGCEETYPVDHPDAGEPGFRQGKWVGWHYLDLNRADLIDRPLRFCGMQCLVWWLASTKAAWTWARPPTNTPMSPLDLIQALAERGH